MPKTIEDKYKKLKDQHEHILKRPGMYIGSTKREKSHLWVHQESTTDPAITHKEISYVPGLYKIFDEILVNARDHVVRCIEEKKDLCTKIEVSIDKASGKISIRNNGEGIPVVEHKEHSMLIPSLIFGELLSSSNYNDDEKRKVGGTNGLGAKLTNIYSTGFEVETLDSSSNKKFYQKFTNNMYTKGKAAVASAKGKKSYTLIRFIPDYERFGIKGLTSDILSLFKKRVYDIAMSVSLISGTKVYYNDEQILSNSFAKYIDLYFPEGSGHHKVLDTTDPNWKICVVYDPTGTMDHQNISFVNGICTSRGGTHVEHVSNQIVNKIKESVSRKVKNLVIKPSMIKENLVFFVDATIVNPEFDTQTKELLKTKVADFGSTYSAPESFLKKIIKTGVVDQIISNAQALEEAKLQRSGKARGAVAPKHYPAGKYNTKEGYKCTLILTEGDSAKLFAMSGFNVIGREYFGVFPLRGKLLNVRDASPTKICDNVEIQAITNIVGLEHKKVYVERKSLKYGSIMVLTDQDTDGTHIKGLVMNFIHHFWPSLIKFEGFIKSFATPLLKAFKGKNKEKIVAFTNMPDFEEWKKKNNDGKGWTIKYYKGLGTHSAEEQQQCFRNMDEKIINYYWQEKLNEKIKENEEGGEEAEAEAEAETEKKEKLGEKVPEDVSKDAITLAFAKKREDDRKQWINTFNPDSRLNNGQRRISYYEFIHKELIEFSVYDVARSIPSIMDGFKPGQRKIYYGCVKKRIYDHTIKVAQLSGYIAEHTHYHHGEQSLNESIVKMAQTYVGSNNINLLHPDGTFGSRLSGGKDAASPRYIFTKLIPLGRKIFIEDDFDVLQQQTDDGDVIEPVYYGPIIPMVLVNGAEGIGTGYSTSIEPCNPRDIYHNIKRIIANETPKMMTPWYRHFTGSIEKVEKNKFVSRAKYSIIGEDTIHITDLPIGTWTDNYKEFLENLLFQGGKTKKEEKKVGKGKKSKGKKSNGTKPNNKRSGSKKSNKKSNNSIVSKVAKHNDISSDIKTYSEDCTDVRISFTIVFKPGKLKAHMKNGSLEKDLKLVTSLNLTNMHLFDENRKIKKYNSYGAILKNFAKVRLDLYQKRKDYLLGKWKKEIDMFRWKLKFVLGVIAEKIIVFKKKTDEIIAQLVEQKFPKFSTKKEELGPSDDPANDSVPSYKYLTSMTILKFSTDEVEKLRKQIEGKEEDMATLESKTPPQMWLEELDDFMEEYDKWEAETDADYDRLLMSDESKEKKKKKKGKGGSKSKKTVEL